MFQEKEQRDDIVTDVLGEIIDESLNIILQRHIDRIAVHKAVKDVTQILSDSLKLYFISHDQGKEVITSMITEKFLAIFHRHFSDLIFIKSKMLHLCRLMGG